MNLKSLAFWKKKDDFGDLGLPKDSGSDLGLGPLPGEDFSGGASQGFPKPGEGPSYPTGLPSAQQQNFNFPIPKLEPANPYTQNYGSPSYPSAQQGIREAPPQYASQGYDQNYMVSKEIEILSSKLDALRANLESINQRLANVERMMRMDLEHKTRYQW